MPHKDLEKQRAYRREYMREYSKRPKWKEYLKEYRIKRYRGDTEYREREKNRNKALYWEKRLSIINLLGGKCVRCGFSDPRALQIDHINGGGEKELKGFKHNTTAYYKYILDIIQSGKNKEYQLLCANCNMIKRHVFDAQ
jgi:hypothetical protein